MFRCSDARNRAKRGEKKLGSAKLHYPSTGATDGPIDVVLAGDQRMHQRNWRQSLWMRNGDIPSTRHATRVDGPTNASCMKRRRIQGSEGFLESLVGASFDRILTHRRIRRWGFYCPLTDASTDLGPRQKLKVSGWGAFFGHFGCVDARTDDNSTADRRMRRRELLSSPPLTFRPLDDMGPMGATLGGFLG